MAKPPLSYSRIDVDAVQHQEALAAGRAERVQVSRYGIRRWVPVFAVGVSALQAVIQLYMGSAFTVELSGSLIPTLGFGLLFVLVLAVNPLVHWLELRSPRVPRPLGRVELMLIFSCMLLTSGVSTFGLVEMVVPHIATPFNPELNVPQRGWDESLTPQLNKHLYITDARAIEDYRDGFVEFAPRQDAPLMAHVRYQWYVLTHVPWWTWAKPLFWWSIFFFAMYSLFYSLAYIVLPFWSEREKLIFPLAKLPELLLPESDDSGRWLPPVMTHPEFWMGFMVSFFILLWNGGFMRENYPGLERIVMGMASWTFDGLVRGSMLERMGSGISFLFLFTAMGLAFLLPKEMSFSVWFYYLLSRVFQIVLEQTGLRPPGGDGSNFLWQSSPLTSIAGGGLLMFAGITLLLCLRQFGWLVRSRSWRKRLLYGLPVFGLMGSVAVLTLWLTWCGLDPWWALGLVVIITLMILGLMRIVAESGLYWFQCNFGPFHLFQMFGMGRVIAGLTVAPFLLIYSTLFLDMKCLMAPNMLTAAKLREDVGGARVRYHVTLATSLLVSILASYVTSIYMSYSRGAARMHWWFYNRAPVGIMDSARDLASTPPHFSAGKVSWLVIGALWVAATAYFRQTMFWVPHPIGFIMLVNPLMNQLWMSFFVAWCIKKLVLHYGGKMTSDRVRDAFVGLIMGELIAISFYTALVFITGKYPALITLNKYGP